MTIRWAAGAALIAVAVHVCFAQAPPRRADRQVVIVLDGLRPDYVTPELMPRLHRLGQRGIVFTAHHSVYPTVTRLNASTFVTGAYPETHGLMGNTIYVPAVSPTRVLDTGARENLEAVGRADGRLLTAPTLGEILQSAGRTLLAIGSGTTGATYLLNHTVASGAVMHSEYTLPQALSAHVTERLGPVPPAATPNRARHRRAVDTYLTLGLDEIRPDLTFIWLNDPDATAHAKGIGSAPARESLAVVDAEVGRIEDTLRSRGLLERTNLIIATDHGFSTHTGELKLSALVEPFARPMPDGSRDIVVAEGAIYFRGRADADRVAAVVAALQKRPEVGAIFTRPRAGGGAEGVVPGTLSFDVARWNHARAGDILVSANWSRAKNEAGYEGTTTIAGVAGHGASSPYDVHATLIAAGPDFREHATSDVPTGNVDLAPTLLRLLGLQPAPSMTGRVIEEALRDGPSPASVRVEHLKETVKSADGSYTLTAYISIAAGRRDLDYSEVVRPR
jgi:arylsulfatase A-like enzyme